nr:PREDICTED: dirigent protein 11-like [Musa acuminata subsp. malaccensis]
MNRKYEPKSKPKSYYGNTIVVDDPLARWPGLTSKLVGRARGSHVVASHSNGEPDKCGSLAVSSIYPKLPDAAELPVVGGSEPFCMARSYVLSKTYKGTMTPLFSSWMYEVA